MTSPFGAACETFAVTVSPPGTETLFETTTVTPG